MSVLGATLTFLYCLLVMTSGKRGAALSIIVTVCYITQGQELVLGFHFTAIRLVLLAGLIRTVVRGELREIRMNSIDRALVAYLICMIVVPSLRVGTLDSLVYAVGFGYNALLSYFVFRALLPGRTELREVLAILPWLILPFAVFIVLEVRTGKNLYSMFGGVDFTMIRDGQVRGSAAFRSPITAGSFGATCALLFCSQLFAGGKRLPCLIGLMGALAIVGSAHSSGPLLGLVAGLVCLACWRFRAHTRFIRWSIICGLVGLQLVMKAPVWFLIGRISNVVGGGGFYRAYLIDKFVSSFSAWWLAGTNDTVGWMPSVLANGVTDLTNQFVSDGVASGLLGFILAIMVMVRCFQAIGLAMDETDDEGDDARLLWGLGATLAGNIAILFSVTYFDQMHVIWYFLLASIAACSFDESESTEESDDESVEANSVTNPSWVDWRHPVART